MLKLITENNKTTTTLCCPNGM